jgi:hypothetical protein
LRDTPEIDDEIDEGTPHRRGGVGYVAPIIRFEVGVLLGETRDMGKISQDNVIKDKKDSPEHAKWSTDLSTNQEAANGWDGGAPDTNVHHRKDGSA